MKSLITVFISYSWEDDEHKEWVLKLADQLTKDGINVILDRYYLTPGSNLPKFVEDSIEQSDRIILVCTPKYKDKSDKREGGVGHEYSLINQDLLSDLKDNKTIIPILRKGNNKNGIPKILQQYIYIDFVNDSLYKNRYEDLIRDLYKEHKVRKPPIGNKPNYLGTPLQESDEYDDVILSYDPLLDKMYRLNRWSRNRMLKGRDLAVETDWSKITQDWFDNQEWETEIKLQNQKYKGDVGYLTGFQLDHRESEYGMVFKMNIKSCTYGDRMASEKMLDKYPDVRSEIEKLLKNNPHDYLVRALPSVIYVNVMIISEQDNFLAFKRSNVVATRTNVWTAGLTETMMMPRVAMGNIESLFKTAKRGLKEEADLEEDDYGKVVISAMAIYSKSMAVAVFAQVRVNKSESEVLRKANESFSVYEHEKFEWLPFNKKIISEYIGSNSGMLSVRKWHQNSKMALQEAWRMRSEI